MVGGQCSIDRDQFNKSQRVLVSNSERETDGRPSKETPSEPKAVSDNVISLGTTEQSEIGRKLRKIYDDLGDQPLPQDVAEAVAELDRKLRESDDG